MQNKNLIPYIFILFLLIISGCSHKKDNEKIKELTNIQESNLNDSSLIESNLNDTSLIKPIENETIKEINIIAKNWEFQPSQITVNYNDLIRLKIKSIDVKRGISIPDFNIHSELIPNEETIIEFKANKKGTFNFNCSVLYGPGHRNMNGKITIE